MLKNSAFCLASLLAIAAAPAVAADVTYTNLRQAGLAGGVVAVHGLLVQRDALTLQLDAGTVQYLEAVGGRIIGAVFVGRGSYELKPATETERRHLAVVTGEQGLTSLKDEFETAVLLFTDDTAQQLGSAAGAADPRAAAVLAEHAKRQRQEYKTNFHIRLLQDLLDEARPHRGVFLAFIDGKKHGQVVAGQDPLGAEALRLQGGLVGGEETFLFKPRRGFWYLSRARGTARRGVGTAARPVADAVHYAIDTRIDKQAGVQGTTTIRLQTLMPGVRVVPVNLHGQLRIRTAELATDASATAWAPVPFIQEAAQEDADVAIVLPAALPSGATATLRIAYQGTGVLHDGGDGNYYVEARESWYPNLAAFSDPATFELTFTVSKDREVIAVGRQVETRLEGENRVSTWRAEQPLRVAGFNYGKFKKTEKSDADSGVTVQVYTNPGTPDVIKEINTLLQQHSSAATMPLSVGDVEAMAPAPQMGPRELAIDTQGLANAALADGINMARLGSAYFGKLPPGQVAITQQSQWAFGQSWPTLIYLPFLAFIDGTNRMQMGLTGASTFVDQVGPHEFAHQWWGHLVGFESYRDQWLSEGFAEFSTALLLQHAGGAARYDAFWENARRRIVGQPRGAAIGNYEMGPITQGWRLSTPESGGAYMAMVYNKGAYVLHMLRSMMWDPTSQQPNARFVAMMKDFVTSYSGKQPSTSDFQRVVERHMVPTLNATGDGKMDWFFGQWVHGTEIPRYTQDLKVVGTGGDSYRIQGTASQSEVSADFRALVPLYVELDKGQLVRVGVLPFMGPVTHKVDVEVRLPKKPKRAAFNARHDVLAKS